MLPDSQNNREISSLPVLNPEQMGVLREEGLVEALTELFKEMAGGTMDAMAAALESGDLRELSSKAHLLKGSAVNFGADRLVAVCQEIEQSAISLDKATLEKLLDAVRAEYQLVSEALDAAQGN
jgi:HPt (histidine-containing phosphotransfer) domain-containing protein